MFSRCHRPWLPAAAALLLAGPVAAQQFEVVSIKPNRGGSDGTVIKTQPGGRFVASNATLKDFIEFAFGVRDFQVAGAPGWAERDAWDVAANAPDGKDIDDDALKPMMQSLLATRFQFKFHREVRQLPVYSLLVEKSGAKLTPHKGTDGPSGRTLVAAGRATLTAKAVPIAALAENLARAVGRPVTDNTGLMGLYDLKLEWTPDQTTDAGAASIFTALREQLGLRLEPARGPVDVIVVDAAERASEN
jgi:uncharacterized protein (TIGR03435 family)